MTAQILLVASADAPPGIYFDLGDDDDDDSTPPPGIVLGDDDDDSTLVNVRFRCWNVIWHTVYSN